MKKVAALLDSVTVITVTYNSAHCVRDMAKTLALCPNVTVVDNASADSTVTDTKRLLPRAQVIVMPRNVGYGAANNAAINVAETPYVLLLNPDCVDTPEQIAELIALAHADPSSAMWVPQLLSRDGSPQLNYSMPRHRGTPRTGAADGPLCVGYACAAALLIHRQRMATVGLFDTRFFLYYEDEDLCLRAFKARQPIVVLPQVVMTHHSRSSVRGPRPLAAEYLRGWHHAQSKIAFANKHGPDGAGQRLLTRSLRNAYLHLALRALLPSPRLLARTWGRLRGLRQLQKQSRSYD